MFSSFDVSAMIQAAVDAALKRERERVAKQGTIAASELPDHLAVARETYCVNDDVQIDDDARISQGTTGVWVQAWVWVADSDVKLEFEIKGLQ